ncbi:hypothetical protein K439DRAFT_1627878 [Ramaria rubella]|nr:hypothetical protein K439DRAFT_1627878 [Ramaria rubella]
MRYYTAKCIRIGLGAIGACLTLIGTAINLFTDANTFGTLKVLIDGGIILTAVVYLIDSFVRIKHCHSFVMQIMRCRSFFAQIMCSHSHGAQGFWDIEAAEVKPGIKLVDMGNFDQDGLIRSLENTLANGK